MLYIIFIKIATPKGFELFGLNLVNIKIIAFFKLCFACRMKYIEDQLSKRKGKAKLNEEGTPVETKYCSPEEAALQAVPNHLRASSTQRSEEMLSNQMLSGIPEVDLGIE